MSETPVASDVLAGRARWAVEHDDCRSAVAALPDRCVDAVITDWPYGVDIADWDGKMPYDLLPEFLRVASGPVIAFGSASHIREDLLALAVPPERVLVWAPSFTLSHTRCKSVFYRYHPIYCWRLPDKHDGPAWDVLRHPTECGNWWKHECTKPESLMEDLVRFTPEDALVLDPFVGSGTTLVAALKTGRRAFGWEKTAEHVDTARKRCGKAASSPRQTGMFRRAV